MRASLQRRLADLEAQKESALSAVLDEKILLRGDPS
jgi:hypothetical protein